MHTSAEQAGCAITFLGTGEACDPQRANTSILVNTAQDSLLLDCGFTAAQRFIALEEQKPAGGPLQAVWISHLHGDHVFGLPQLIASFQQQKRKAPLTLLSGTSCREYLLNLIRYAYPNLLGKLDFPLNFQHIEQTKPCIQNNFSLQTASVDHGTMPAHALRLHTAGKTIYYSGDGAPTDMAKPLMQGCDLVIQEAFSRHSDIPGHYSIALCQKLQEQEVQAPFAMVHLSHETRRELRQLHPSLSLNRLFFFPEDGERIVL